MYLSLVNCLRVFQFIEKFFLPAETNKKTIKKSYGAHISNIYCVVSFIINHHHHQIGYKCHEQNICKFSSVQ